MANNSMVFTGQQMNKAMSRAQGCLLGQLAGDSLGSLVEFKSAEEIKELYPQGVTDLHDGGMWGTLAGQPTDDSEMALMLARSLVKEKRFDIAAVRETYVDWLNSKPFDCGRTVSSGLLGKPNPQSQANGAMMRIAPLGIFGCNRDLDDVAEWARLDAGLTHPNTVCVQANVLFVNALAIAIRTGCAPDELYQNILTWADEMAVEPELLDMIKRAEDSVPEDYLFQMGWVLIAFQNALWQLLHAPGMAAGVIDTVGRGGDTDTNAAICGALLGAVYGAEAIPEQWKNCILNCRPRMGDYNVRRPRPECFWPVDALELVAELFVL